MKKTIYVYDHSTGQEITREPDAEELANIEAGEAAKQARLTEQAGLANIKEKMKEKLSKLGLTEDEIKLLGL